MAQLDEGTRKAAGAIGQGAPGADTALNTMQSAMAASSAMLDSLSRASRQFAEISEANMKAITAGMFSGTRSK